MNTFENVTLMDSTQNYLSPEVRDIASLVYSEFERLVSRYGSGVVDGIVPIMIRALERVDQLHEEIEVLNSCVAQNESELKAQTARLDREIKARRSIEEKVIALEDELAEVIEQSNRKVADYTRLVRVLEAKCDAASDHVSRLEAKETELREELSNARRRCNELLSLHVAHLERTQTWQRKHTLSKSPQYYHDDRKECVEKIRSAMRHDDHDAPNQPVITLPLRDDHEVEEALFNVLDEPSDFEQCLDELTVGRVNSEDSDDVSKVSDDCEYTGMASLEKEVKNLVAENQELVEMKNALNILKDDLLVQIDEISGENAVLKSDLGQCQHELRTERKRALSRERRLQRRVHQLSVRLRVCERVAEGRHSGVLVRSLSQNLVDDVLSSAGHSDAGLTRRRTRSCGGALGTAIKDVGDVAVKAEKIEQPQQQTQKESETPSQDRKPSSSSSTSGGGTMRLSKREIARIVVERNYYKEHYFEARERLRAIEINNLTQPPPASSSQALLRCVRKREMASALFTGIIESMHNFATEVAQGIEQIAQPTPPRPQQGTTPPQPRSRASTALWNILGNFVGQAVSYTTDALIGTGHDLPLHVSRPMITARVNSRLPIDPSSTNRNTPVE